jgi:hypothetical protein
MSEEDYKTTLWEKNLQNSYTAKCRLMKK